MIRTTIILSLLFILMAALPARQAVSYGERFSARGVNLHYVVIGKGEPVVLIHGFSASAEKNWQLPGIINLLAKDYQVIALDMPGHGASDKPVDEDAYGEQMVEDVILLLDHLKIKKAHIVGYSMGGMITMKLMARHPDRVSSGLVCGFGWLRSGSFMQRFFSRPRQQRSEHLSICFNSLSKLALTEAEVKQIKVPAAVIVGDRDPVKRLYVMPLQQLRRDWPVVEIADAGHLSCVAKPQFKAEIKKWLDRQED